ncbi:MAG: nitrate reductase [Nitrospirae bacterium]|nr:MAG: nitrate reductase [Nitrospirota bacterium]
MKGLRQSKDRGGQMNIAGIVVRTVPEHLDVVMEALETDGLSEVHFHDATGKIIVTVEGGGDGEEVTKMREIMSLPYVISAELAYSYTEDELDLARDKLARGGDAVPERLNS